MHDKGTPFVDFALIKQRVGLAQVFAHYGVTWLVSNGNELRGTCPFHQGEGERSFHANIDKNNFQCFSCKAKGNALDFVVLKENCSVKQAAFYLATVFEIIEAVRPDQVVEKGKSAKSRKSSGISQKSREINQSLSTINPPLAFQLRIDPTHQYGFDRGLSEETIAYFGCGLCLSKGMFGNRYLFPLYDGQGQLVGYAGRALRDDAEPKYLFPPPEKQFFKAHILFGLHQLISAGFNPGQAVVIVEGLFGAAKVHQAGYPCVSLLGSTLSDQQFRLIVQFFKKVILLFDGDAAGRQGTEYALRQLSSSLFVRTLCLEDGRRLGGLEIEKIKTHLNAL